MVVPPCLRSPANSSISLFRLTAAASCRSVSTSGSSQGVKSNLIRTAASGIKGQSSSSSALLKIGSIGRVCNVNFSTVPAPAPSATPRIEDESLIEVLNSSNSGSGSNTTSSATQYAEASDHAWSAFQSLKSSKGTPSSSDYTSVLRQLSEARDFNRCKSLLAEIKAAGIEIDSEMFSLVLNSGRRTLRSNEIRELFGDSTDYFSRNKSGHDNAESSSTTNTPSRSLFFEQFSEIVKEMKSKSIHPTVWFYEEVANFLTSINQAGVLINLATAMEKRGEQPSTKFYNRMLHCLPRCGLLDRASMLFNRLVLKGNADYYTYLVRASSLVYVNQMEAARAVLSDMKGKFQMDAVAYNILIKSYLAQGNCEQAVQVFKQMTRDPSIAPNRVTCRTFLSYFYETANLTHSEPIVSYFEKVNFPETFEDYGNVIKFFARYDPPKVLDIFKQIKEKLGNSEVVHDKNQVYHAFLRVLNDRQVTNDWKNSFSKLILEEKQSKNTSATSKNSPLNAPDLPYNFKMIIERIEAPDSVTYEIVLKKLIQLRRFDAVKSLYQSMFSPQNPHNVSAQPVHRNLYLTALLMSREIEAARDFITEMHARRIPISSKNTGLLEEAGVELPRGALTAKKGQGVTATRSQKSSRKTEEAKELNMI